MPNTRFGYVFQPWRYGGLHGSPDPVRVTLGTGRGFRVLPSREEPEDALGALEQRVTTLEEQLAASLRPFSNDVQRHSTRTAEALRFLDTRLRELERLLDEMRLAVQYGPVPGAYYPILLQADHATLLSAASVVDTWPINFNFKPLRLNAWVNAGQVTINVHCGSGQILTNDLVVTSSGATAGDAGEFAIDPVPQGDVWLEIVSVDSGSPTNLRVVLTAANLSRIDFSF